MRHLFDDTENHCWFMMPRSEALIRMMAIEMREGRFRGKCVVDPSTWEALIVEFSGRAGTQVEYPEIGQGVLVIAALGAQLRVISNGRFGFDVKPEADFP